MSDQTAASLAPDRLLARTSFRALAVLLVLMLAGGLATERIVGRQEIAASAALAAAEKAALAHEIAKGLDRMASDPAAPRTLAQALHPDVQRLMALERRGPSRIGATGSAGADYRRLLDGIGRLAGGPDGVRADREAAALKRLVQERILPELDATAAGRARHAERTFSGGRRLIVATVVLQLLGLAGIAFGVFLPMLDRVRSWMNRMAESERESRFRMLHDSLTQLPNGTYLRSHLERVAAQGGPESIVAVLRIDLDRFNALRETVGQRAGDEVVRAVARRIGQCLRDGDFAAYLGNDDFVVVACGLADEDGVAHVAHRLQDELSKPLSIRGAPHSLGCSIGVSLFCDDRGSVEHVLGNAELALSEAQSLGAGHVRNYRASMREEVEQRRAMFAELSGGIEAGEIVPFFQPQVVLATGALSGFEALARWQHPNRGLLGPAAFLDFAERADLTGRIGEVILRRSLEALRAWDAAGFLVPKVGINFALSQLRDPRLIEKIKWEVERFDLEPGRIAIEVLETVLIKSDADVVVRNLRGLASAGFGIELDDFGTGHASISNLRRFSVNRIKIDRSFVSDIETSAEQQKLTASMIALAGALGIQTVAEGVETAEAAETLSALGCGHVQGYLIARPMAFGDTLVWLAESGARGAAAAASRLA